ncbi:Ig-like domain-containing protein [Jongsikchunia kroppenstedtii]|uniref:Ig-like domain-containing protein n=1 Tax=Jongsikchunia kroppenstedtii TaxID=1121721 RepID=UPI001FDEB5C9|nr:Ig-like domain-containing protein [Jongsikchunia kroppenstedtii]
MAAATGAVAMAAAGVVALGQGTASAAQGTVTWNDGNDKLTRTISEINPAVGDTITVWTTIERTGGVLEIVQAAKDAHPACWQYVPGSAQVNGSAKGLDSSSAGDANNMGWQRVTGSWTIYPNINPHSVWFTMQYKIGADCPTGVPMNGAFYYSTSLGEGNEGTRGPAVTVQAPATQNTTTTLQAPGTATTGQAVNLTASVSPSAAGGTVQFKDNGSNIGAPVAVANGSATLSQTFNTAGAHSITAVYSGGDGYNGSSSAASTVTVSDPAPVDQDTTTTLQAPGTATTGQAVNLTASVSPSAAGGTVQFKDNGINIGSPVAVANGSATLSQTFNTAGAHSITAVYSGGTGYNGSTSAASTVTVSAPGGGDGGTGGNTGGSGSLSNIKNIFGS